jgi:2-polyprenyl-3-methyl-5-hydroxy-6-metoxy-1,4-benzoquinol methylase
MKNELDSHVKAYQGGNIYDFDNEIILNWYPRRILAKSEGAKSILELGLGHGITTNIFTGKFDKHVVVEGSSAIIDNFKIKHPDCSAKIIQSFFEDYETDEKYDVIVIGFVLEHVDDPYEILCHVKKLSSKDSKIFIAVPNAEGMNRRLGYLAGMLKDMNALSDNDIIQGHKRYYTVQTLTEHIQLAGYTIDFLEGIYLKPFTTRQMVSLNLDPKIIRALCELGVDYPELSLGLFAQISIAPK